MLGSNAIGYKSTTFFRQCQIFLFLILDFWKNKCQARNYSFPCLARYNMTHDVIIPQDKRTYRQSA